MSGVSITGLNPASTLTGSEIVPVVQSGTTVRTTLAAMPYVPAGTEAVTTSVQTKLRETVSVKDFGAVGDGVTDDTAAIQAAIDSFGSNGGILIFPHSAAGYKYTNIQVKKSNITLDFQNSLCVGQLTLVPQSLVTSGRLAGTDYPSTWRNASNVPKPVDGDFNTMMYESVDANRLKNIIIKNMKVDAGSIYVPIYAYSVDDLIVTGGNIQPASQSAIRAFHCSRININNNTLGGGGTYTVFGFKCREIVVDNNFFISTTSTRALSFKGVMHQDGQSIFSDFSTSPTYFRFFDCLVANNHFVGGKDGVFWDTTPYYTINAATDAGSVGPLAFTSGSWYGQGSQFNLVNNQFNLFSGDPASAECRSGWFSAPHKDVIVANNNITSGQVYGIGLVNFVVRGNKFRYLAKTNAAINVAYDSVTSTTATNFVVDGNTVNDYDALTAAIPYGINIQGVGGVVKNNTCFGIGTYSGFATGFVGLQTTTNEVHIENNKLFKNGGTQSVLVSGSQNANGKKFNNDTHDLSTSTYTTDGYKKGTFTPVLVGSTTAGTGTYSYQVGRYTQVGNRCMFTIRLDWSAHTGTGSMYVQGLPFTSDSTSGNNATISIWADSLTYGSGTLSGYITSGGSTIVLSLVSSNAVAASIPMDTTGTVFITGSYEITV